MSALLGSVVAMNDLRVLTVKQPLAWAIAHGHKDVENRSWRFPLPLGATIGIHAGWKRDDDLLPVQLDPPDELPGGVIVAVARVVADHHASECDCRSPWAYDGDTRHWVLEDVRLLEEPVAVRGQLWLFQAPADVAADVMRQTR